ncbi:hypothetical protein D515_03493 [Grimontia indica]|uniref:Uncharacterized protein n=1 Tax=Grimontia indica TaxID=1056512 RepID=R1IAE2_9GAMM|nr:hypothetical protein D515_03493 [Grimontia indica]
MIHKASVFSSSSVMSESLRSSALWREYLTKSGGGIHNRKR